MAPPTTVDSVERDDLSSFIVVQIFCLLNCRSLTHSFFSVGVFSNVWIIYGTAAMIALQLAFTYAGPFNLLFQTEPIALEVWGAMLAVGVLTYVTVEVEKHVRNRLGIPAA